MIKKYFIIISLLLSGIISAGPALASSDFIYKSPNKLDFVKLDKASKSEKQGGIKHPYNFEFEQIRAILRSIHFNKKVVIMKDLKNQQLFDESNVEFLAGYLTEAFQKATPEQVVEVSYFTKDTKVVIQDDRLSIFRAFIKDDGLHVKFTKLYAKLLGDRTTQGANRASSEARGLRVGLELQPGQNRIGWDPEELVFDLDFFRNGGVSKPEKLEKTKSTKSEADPTVEVQKKAKSIRERLKELEQMKKDEMITDKEYQTKRKALLEEL